MIRTYSELSRLKTYEERYNYLRLLGTPGRETFGFARRVNQAFYQSKEWKKARRLVIARDLGFDMGFEGYPAGPGAIVHHMNPLIEEDILSGDPAILDPEFLITVSHNTHNAIHYGSFDLLPQPVIERTPGDTTPWR